MDLSELGRTPTGRTLVRLAGPDNIADLRSVRLLPNLPDLPTPTPAGRGDVLVVQRHDAHRLTGHHLEVALRRFASVEVAVVVLVGVEKVARTAAALAARAGIGLFGTSDDTDITALLLGLDRELRGGPDLVLARAEAIITAIGQSPSIEELRAAVSTITGTQLMLKPSDGEGALVTLDGRPYARVNADGVSPIELRLIADGIAHVESARRRRLLPALRTGELLVTAITTRAGQDGVVLERLHDAGFSIDGWHCAVRIEPADAHALSTADLIADVEFHNDMVVIAQTALRRDPAGWHAAPFGDGLILIRSWRSPPQPSAHPGVLDTADRTLDVLGAGLGITLRCGAGRVGQGMAGLRASAAEAQSAMVSATASGARRTVAFDARGSRRMLQEWLGTDSARHTVAELLAPIDRLGAPKASVLIETLHVFLEEEGSLVRAAGRLRTHRNTVIGRIERAKTVLDDDLSDPEARLMLRLACQARLIGMSKP